MFDHLRSPYISNFQKTMATIDLTGVEFVKKASMSPLTGSWVPGGEDDVECQVSRF